MTDNENVPLPAQSGKVVIGNGNLLGSGVTISAGSVTIGGQTRTGGGIIFLSGAKVSGVSIEAQPGETLIFGSNGTRAWVKPDLDEVPKEAVLAVLRADGTLELRDAQGATTSHPYAADTDIKADIVVIEGSHVPNGLGVGNKTHLYFVSDIKAVKAGLPDAGDKARLNEALMDMQLEGDGKVTRMVIGSSLGNAM